MNLTRPAHFPEAAPSAYSEARITATRGPAKGRSGRLRERHPRRTAPGFAQAAGAQFGLA